MFQRETTSFIGKAGWLGMRAFPFSPTTSCKRVVTLIIKTNLGSGLSKINFRLGNVD